MKVIKKILSFFKNLFGQDVKVSIDNNSKYNIKKNKKCDISINDLGDNNERK